MKGSAGNLPKRASRWRDRTETERSRTADRIGLVLSGGGARGAYEAGVMSVLGPALAARGERPSIYIGTSVGAVNAAYMAASEHLPADEAGEGGLRALARGEQGDGHPSDPAAPGAADGAALRGRDPLPAGDAAAQPARPEAVRAQPRPLDRLGRSAPQRGRRRGRDRRHGRDRRAQRPHRGVRRGPRGADQAQVARDRLRHDAARRPARARVGGDPDPVPAGAGRAPERGARLVLRRRHAAEHSDQAGARPGRRAADRDRDRLGRRALEAPGPPRLRAARLRRRRAARAAGHAGRPGRRGHAHPRQHQHVLRRPRRRGAASAARRPAAGAHATSPPSATARRAASRRTAASPTSSSRPRSGARSAAWRRRCSATATAA